MQGGDGLEVRVKQVEVNYIGLDSEIDRQLRQLPLPGRPGQRDPVGRCGALGWGGRAG